MDLAEYQFWCLFLSHPLLGYQLFSQVEEGQKLTLQNTSSGLSFSLILRWVTNGFYTQKDNKRTLQITISGLCISSILRWVSNGFHRQKDNKRTLHDTSSGLSFPLTLCWVTNSFYTQKKDNAQTLQNPLAELDIQGRCRFIEKSLLLTQTARFSKNRVRCVSQEHFI